MAREFNDLTTKQLLKRYDKLYSDIRRMVEDNILNMIAELLAMECELAKREE